MAEGYTLLEELDQATAVNASDKLYAVKENGDDVKVSVNQLKTFVTPPDADSLTPGIVNTDTQAFSGRKTFNSGIGAKDVTVVEGVTAGGSVTATGEVHGSNIPSTATAENPLADQDFVNSSIATNTANFCGTFNSLEELEAYEGEKTNNDYAFVIGADEQGNTRYARYKYTGSAWEFEYYLNNSSFTAEQWAAIQSGITAELVALIGQASGSSPIGTILSFAGENVPAGFLLCDGRELLIEDYPKLYEAIGHLPYCQSENEGYFKLLSFTDKAESNVEYMTGKRHADGRPTYIKIYIDPNNSWSTTDNIIGSIENFKEAISVRAVAFNDTGLSGWVENNEGGSARCYGYIKSNGDVHFYRNDVRDGIAYPKKVIIEYTKTTDTADTPCYNMLAGTNYIIKATSTDDGIDEIIDDNTTDNGHAWSGEKVSDFVGQQSLKYNRPAYENRIEIPVTDTTEHSYTCPQDGMIMFNLYAIVGNLAHIKINGVMYYQNASSNNNFYSTLNGQISVRKGDVISYKSGYVYAGYSLLQQIVFVPYSRRVDDPPRQGIQYQVGEVDTGNTWIDGKPIYRKVYTNTNTVAADTALVENCDTLIKISGETYCNLGYFITVPFAGASYDIFIYKQNNTVKFNTHNLVCSNAKIVIEYTKTTD